MAIDINNATSPRPVQTQTAQIPGKELVNSQVKAGQKNTVPEISETKETEQQDLELVVSNINDFVQNIQRSVQFSVSEDSGRTIIEVYDAASEELIREIPSEELQRISKAIEEQISSGLLLKVNI